MFRLTPGVGSQAPWRSWEVWRRRGGIRPPPEGACPVRVGGWGGQLDGPALLTNMPYKTANCEEWRSFPPFSLLRLYEAPKNGVSILLNAVW